MPKKQSDNKKAMIKVNMLMEPSKEDIDDEKEDKT
tara:strand:- start:376 stop:480 length:105 start_codon:yes stop_codon:yes gene_type:complete